MAATGFVLGIDVGQSKTRYLACTRDGEVVVFREGKPCARLIDPSNRESVWKAFEEEVRAVLELAGRRLGRTSGGAPGAVCLGISGVASADSPAGMLWRDLLSSRMGWRSRGQGVGEGEGEGVRLVVNNDMVSALAGAACLGPGVVVVSGSGSVAYGRNPSGASARAGGWGYLLGDEGSGFAIGLEGVRTAISGYDGGGPADAVQLAARHFGLGDLSELKFSVYSGDVELGDIARFAEDVSRAACQGRDWAVRILERAGTDLARLVGIVLERVSEAGWSPGVFPTGRVLENNDIVARTMMESVASGFPRVSFRVPELPPVAGSALIAGQALDGAIRPGFVARLKHGLASAGADVPRSGVFSFLEGSVEARETRSRPARGARWTPRELAAMIKGRLIASVQARPGDRTEDPAVLAAMVEAVVAGGAAAVRVNGPEVVRLARARVGVPVLGINKVGADRSEVYITPSLGAAAAVITAGADMVAVDATRRPRPDGSSAAQLIASIRGAYPDVAIVADISTVEEAVEAFRCGADFAATTLAGYTPYSRQIAGCDFELIRQASLSIAIPVIAEGRIATPGEAARALDAGAWAVVVGSAVTRPKAIAESFVQALEQRDGGTAEGGARDA